MDDIYTSLALLYLKKQDIKELSPAEFYDRYREVLNEITNEASNYKAKTKISK